MEQVTISVKLINELLQYLGTRPFVDVAGLINGIHTEVQKQIPPQPEQAESETTEG